MSVCTTGDNLRSSLLPRLPSGAVIGPLGTTKSLAKRSFETAVLQKLKALLSMSAWPLTLSFVDHKKTSNILWVGRPHGKLSERRT